MEEKKAQPQGRRGGIVRVWRAVAGLRVGVVLLVLIAAASVVGIVLPQPESFARGQYVNRRLAPASDKALSPKQLATMAKAAGIAVEGESPEELTQRAQAGRLSEHDLLRLFYIDSYGPLLGRAMLALQVHVLFKSIWFRALCALLVANLVACSSRRLGGQWRAAFGLRPSKDPAWYGRRATHASLKVSWKADDAMRAIDAALRAEGFRVRRRRGSAWATVEGTRGWLGGLERLWWPMGKLSGLGRLGAPIVHLGVVLIVIGGFASGALSFRHAQPMAPGNVVVVPDLAGLSDARKKSLAETDWRDTGSPPKAATAFRLRLDRFDVRFTAKGKPEYYGAHVALLDQQPPVTQVIEVNRPLIYRGYYAYQQSYQTDYARLSAVSLTVDKVRREPGAKASPHGGRTPVQVLSRALVSVGPEGTLTLPGTGLSLRVLRYFPHWVIPFERTPDGHLSVGKAQNTAERFNPAVQVRLEAPGHQPQERWVPLPLPMRPGEVRGAVDYADFRITPTSFQPAYNTVLTFKTHPVLWPVWLGCGVVMVGVCLCFYCNHERVWALVALRDDEKSCDLHLAGDAFKWRERFRERFAAVVATLKEKSSGKSLS